MRSLGKKLLHYVLPTPRNTYRPYLLRRQWLLFFATVVLTTEGVFVAGLVARQLPAPLPAAVVSSDVITYTNVARAREAEASLRENALLDAAAQAKADDMAQKGYFAHVGPEGKEPWRWIEEAGYSYQYAGENLAVRFDDSEEVVNAWMASPTHRANILKSVYTELGVATARGTYEGLPATFVVQYFGTPHAPGQVLGEVTAEPTEAPAPHVAGASAEVRVAATTSVSEGSAPRIPAVQAEAPSSPIRPALEALARSSESTSWILGAMLLALIGLVGFAFFIHIEIQSHEALMGGALVASLALLFLVLNAQVPRNAASQTAAIGGAYSSGVIDPLAAASGG